MQLSGRKIAVTGKLNTMTLTQCLTLLKIVHAQPQTHVNHQTDLLIMGTIHKNLFEAPETTRLQLAQTYHIPIISEKQFLDAAISELHLLQRNLT